MKRSLRKSHGTIWKAMAVVIPAIIIAAILVKQDRSDLPGPVQISPPASTTDGGS